MATTIDDRSVELTQVQPPSYSPLKPNQEHGRVRAAVFTYTFASQAAGHDVALCKLPKGARVIGGNISVSATMGTCTLAVGVMGADLSGFIDAAGSVADDIDFFLAAVAITTTPKVGFALTQALNYLYETEKELYLTMTTGTAAAGTQVVKGEIQYVVD